MFILRFIQCLAPIGQ